MIRVINMQSLAKGRPPLPRYGHQACTVSKGKYLVIMGGRNNKIFKKLNNIALNDLSLFNLMTFEWETVALYGIIPPSRWGHSMVSLDENKLVVFGGVNTSGYMNASIYVFEFGEEAVDFFK